MALCDPVLLAEAEKELAQWVAKDADECRKFFADLAAEVKVEGSRMQAEREAFIKNILAPVKP